MTEPDDDRQAIEQDMQDQDAGDPAAAFDALRRTIETQGAQIGAEMTVMRRGLEAAFDQLDKMGPPQDYKPELAQLVQQLAAVAERLHGVEQSPILRQGPDHYAARLERGGEGLVKTAVQQLERQAADLERAGRNLATFTQSAYDRKSQDFRMWTVGLFGLVIGAFLLLLLPRFLPFSADSHVASFVMGQDRVSAGLAMIHTVDPELAGKVDWSSQFYQSNVGGIGACFEEARKTRKEQKCTITVPVPAR